MEKFLLDEQTYKVLAKKLYEELARYESDMTRTRKLEIDKNLLQILLPYLFENAYISRYIPYIDFSGISFEGVDIRFADFRESNVDIDPQLIKNKDLSYVNLNGINMQDKDFADTVINNTVLRNTGAIINIEKLRKKYLICTNLDGCYIIGSKEELVEKGCSQSNFENAMFFSNVSEDEVREKIKELKVFETRQTDNLIKSASQKVKAIGRK